jgi:hypothetical protein
MRALILLFLAYALTGCTARLFVRVDSFDTKAFERTVVVQRPQVEARCAEARYFASSSFEGQMVEQLDQNLGSLLGAVRSISPLGLAPDYVSQSLDNARTNYRSSYDTSKAYLVLPIQGCASLPATTAGLEALDAQLRAGIESFKANEEVFISQLADDQQQFIDGAVEGTGRSSAEVQAKDLELRGSAKQLQYQVERSIFGGSVVADEHIATIIRADERYWKKYTNGVGLEPQEPGPGYKTSNRKARINRVRVSTFFGNADIAVKMDAPGSFTIKGVRMDADAAIAAGAAVLQQGLKYITYAAGLPVPDPASGSGTENTMRAIPEIAENRTIEQQLRTDDERLKRHLRIYLGTLEAQLPDLLSREEETRKGALEKLKEAHDLFTSTLYTTP